MSTIRFVLRTDRKDKNNLCPVHGIYQIAGKRKYFGTDIRLQSPSWDAENQASIFLNKKMAKELLGGVPDQLIPTSMEVDDINLKLRGIKDKIANIEKRFKVNHIQFDIDMVIDALKNDTIPETKKAAISVFEVIDRYLKEKVNLIAPRSLAIFGSLKTHLLDFQKDTKRKIGIEKIGEEFFGEFQSYLLNDKGLFNNTCKKRLSNLRTIVSYARKKKMIVADDYKDFVIGTEEIDVVALTSDEFQRIWELDLSANKCLDQVRDSFVMGCCTGLRHSDLKQLRWENIKGDEIQITVQKTKRFLNVPLNAYAKAILNKYKGMHRPLPVISNQKSNAYLKGYERGGKHYPGIFELAQINENVEKVRFKGVKRIVEVLPKFSVCSFHTSRKTYCSLSLEKGMTAEEVMACSGHSDYRTFQRYIKVTEQRKKLAVNKAWGEIKENKLKAV